MQLNLRMLRDKLKKVEAEVVDLREVIRKAISEEVGLDELASSIVSHAVTEEDTTEILMKMRRQGEDWWRQPSAAGGLSFLPFIPPASSSERPEAGKAETKNKKILLIL